MQQTITIGGLTNHGTNWYRKAIDEALACLNQEEQAVLNFVGEAEEAGNVTITRTWDTDAGTITIVREWTDAAWEEYQTHSANTDFIVEKIREAGFTVDM